MSWNRTTNDQCAYNKNMGQSTASLSYTLDANKFYNQNDCRNTLGLLGGNNVSLPLSNMVDVESDLFNITRQQSKCPERKYTPKAKPNGNNPCGVNKLKHLQQCDMIHYTPRIDHVGYDLKYPGCSTDTQSGVQHPPQRNPVVWKGFTL